MPEWASTSWRRLALATLFAALAAVGGCGTNVVSVQPLRSFPRPVVEPFPADVGVYYPVEFREFMHVEERPTSRGGDWEITLGPSQVQVFDVVFESLFRSSTELEAAQAPADGTLSAVFVPQVEDFQFALPADTKIKIFEIWVKYNLVIYDRAGSEVMRWPFTAYGKTPTAFLKSNGDAINAAAIIALRDAGASMISAFHRDQRLQDWLRQQEAAPLAAPIENTVVENSEDSGEYPEAAEEAP